MKATELCNKLDTDFIKSHLSDDWGFLDFGSSTEIESIYKKRFMGLVYDFASEISSVYTAVFPSDTVIGELIRNKVKNAMLFVHHPASWDTRRQYAFARVPDHLVESMKKYRISLYNLHVPLDDYGEYSTSVNFAQAIGLDIIEPFGSYEGALAGVICAQDYASIDSLNSHVAGKIGHISKLYRYGENDIRGKRVALVAGGGTDISIVREMVGLDIRNLITGVTLDNIFTHEAHELAAREGINIIGTTHYTSESYACMSMVRYFEKLGLKTAYLKDEPIFEDL